MEKKKESLKTEESYYSSSPEDNNPKAKSKSTKKNYFGKNKKLEEDKYFVYKRMEDLNNLEHKFNVGRDEKKMSSQKFNYRFHNMKRQLYINKYNLILN